MLSCHHAPRGTVRPAAPRIPPRGPAASLLGPFPLWPGQFAAPPLPRLWPWLQPFLAPPGPASNWPLPPSLPRLGPRLSRVSESELRGPAPWSVRASEA